MATRPWTSSDDDQLRELHAAERSVRQIAATIDRSRTGTARRLAHLGLSSANRSRTEAATHAHVVDAKARRATLALEHLSDAERLRRQLFAPTVVFNFGGKDNTYEQRTLDKPPIADQLKLVQAVGAAVATLERLARIDADNGVDEAVGMLDTIAAAIAAAADRLPDPDQATP